MLFRNPLFGIYGFLIANFLLIFVIDSKVDDPNQFLCFGAALVIFSFTMTRFINRVIGGA